MEVQLPQVSKFGKALTACMILRYGRKGLTAIYINVKTLGQKGEFPGSDYSLL
jgi:hypothetical protein